MSGKDYLLSVAGMFVDSKNLDNYVGKLVEVKQIGNKYGQITVGILQKDEFGFFVSTFLYSNDVDDAQNYIGFEQKDVADIQNPGFIVYIYLE